MDKRSLIQPDGFRPGIYFNMSNDVYHADAALSHSGIVDLLNHYYDYWRNGPLNKDRPKYKVGKGAEFGDRRHCYLLQRGEFKKRFRTVWDNPHSDKITLSAQEYADLKESIRLLEPAIKKYFTDGYPEVSIFWIDPETGLRCRARVDYLRTFGGLDYKSCRTVLIEKLVWQIADYGYDLQDLWYRRGINEIKQMIRQKRPIAIEGDYDPEWLARFAYDEDTFFKFIFQRSEAPFVWKDIDFDDDVATEADVSISLAKEIYLSSIDKWGVENEWPAGDDKTETIGLWQLPQHIQKRGVKSINN